MIVKMKKYSFLIYHKQYDEFLEKIRELGVLHVKELREGIAENDVLREKMQLSARVQSVIKQLETIIGGEIPSDVSLVTDYDKAITLLARIETINTDKESLLQKKQTTDREAERMRIWGNYNIERLKNLAEKDIYISLFSCQQSRFKPEWETIYSVFEIAILGGMKYFAIVHDTPEPVKIDAEPIKLNDNNITQLEAETDSLNGKIQALDAEIKLIAETELPAMRGLLNSINGNIDMKRVLLSTLVEADSKVMVLEGFSPEPVEETLNAFLNSESVYYEVTNPTIDEEIPIQLNNNSFSKLFEPITKLFSLPNYGELDPTPFFAPFFMLFFGLCLGDGGYGLLILAVATYMKPKAKPDMKGLLTLGQYLGLATVVVGLLTGSFFGIALDKVEWKWLSGVKQYFLTQDNYGANFAGYNPMMIIAVIIGIIQILFGMIVNVLKVNKQHGFKYAVGYLAWVFFIVTLIFYFGAPLLGIILPLFALYVIYAIAGVSVLVILFYNSPGKNIFSNFGSALWNTYNMATGLLGDTLSYIRLFALGLTGSILGGVFNTLAFDLTADANPFVRWLFVLLILLVGHTINFTLCLIGAFVHPMRLTFVEFYKNAGFEGGGKAYQPFKSVQK
jgi:V/A-type H+/Na+-transporting ATPase subunit I